MTSSSFESGLVEKAAAKFIRTTLTGMGFSASDHAVHCQHKRYLDGELEQKIICHLRPEAEGIYPDFARPIEMDGFPIEYRPWPVDEL